FETLLRHKSNFSLILLMNFSHRPAAVERREARRPASSAGWSPSQGRPALPRGGPRARRSVPAPAGAPLPSFPGAKGKTASPTPPTIGAAKLAKISQSKIRGGDSRHPIGRSTPTSPEPTPPHRQEPRRRS